MEKKTFTGKKAKKPSGEQQRRIPLPGWTEAIDVMCTEANITELPVLGVTRYKVTRYCNSTTFSGNEFNEVFF